MAFRKAYGFFRQNLKTGVVEGYVENSFSMSWSSTLVRAWWETRYTTKTYPAYYNPEGYLKNSLKADKSGKYRYFIVRISNKSGNIRVNLTRGTDKFTRRNKQFVVLGENQRT